MDIASIKGQPRQLSGTRAARRLRKTGMVPGIMYGHGEEPQAVSVPLHELDLVLQHGTHLLELDLGGTPQRVLIKEVQYDHLGIEPLHVDLARVSLDERVSVTVPLVLRGDPKGVKEGGLLDQPVVDIEIECLVTEIPESIRVSVADLGIGDSLHLSDITLPEGVTAEGSADLVLCTVRAPTAAEEEEVAAEAEGEGGTEPEVIARKEKEEPGEGKE